MKKFTDFVEAKIAPFVRKIGANVWLAATQEAILAAVPAALVGSVATLFSTFRSLGLDFLPDLGKLNSFSFGLFSLFLAYLLPSVIMEKKRLRRVSKQAGLAGIGLFLLLIVPKYDDAGNIVFGSMDLATGGMLNALVAGYLTALIFGFFGKHSFFKEDTSLPSFITTWFDSIIPWVLCLLIGIVFTFTLQFNLVEAIRSLLMPVLKFSQSIWGFLIIIFLVLFMYSFGISAWVIFPIMQLIWIEGHNMNLELVAQGLAPTNCHTYEVFQMCFIGGQGATLALCIFMAFLSKSKMLKTVGRAAIIPSLFNINEPIVYGAPIAFNPILMIPFWVAGLANSLIVWFSFSSGLLTVPTEVFRMSIPSFLYMPLALNSYKGIILFAVCFVVTALIYYPFFKVYDNQCLLKEEGK